MTEGKVIYDTSVYIEILRSKSFAQGFRSRYETNIPLTYFNSVVVEELLAGATDSVRRAIVEGLYRPFERSRRIITPSHKVWEQTGRLLGVIRSRRANQKDRLSGSFVNDLLIATSAKTFGAKVVTLNADDFNLISQYVPLMLEILKV